MKDEVILKKAIEKARFRIEDYPYRLDLKDALCFKRYYGIIFSHKFAKALGFKLKDLGEWCDNGNEALKFIEKLV